MVRFFSLRIYLFFVSLIIPQTIIFSENNISSVSSDLHELTLYVMPTLHPLNWESPSTLYRSMRSCYIKTIGKPDNYLLGHVAVGLKTSLLSKPLLTAQTSGSLKEKLDLIFKKKVGYAIIGAPLKGRIETEGELRHKLRVYAKREKLAFIRYQINEKAAQRILDFMESYSKKMNEKYAPSDFYGGAFWPRFHQEGAGCSAFGIALLDLINLLQPENDVWELSMKIPMHLIGGEYNNNLRVKYSTLRKTDKWYEGNGKVNEDYVIYSVYEPSKMFDWVMNKRLNSGTEFKPIEENGVPGLLVDVTQVTFDESEPFFVPRTEPNLFINHYLEKIKLSDER